MLLLPPIEWSSQAPPVTVQLPCPAEDWLDLATDREPVVARVLRFNPAVFLTACEGYFFANGEVVGCWRDLLCWSRHHLVLAIDVAQAHGDLRITRPPVDQRRTGMAVAKWLLADANGDLPKLLARFVASSAGLSKRTLLENLPRWLPQQLELSPVSKRDFRGQDQRGEYVSRWQNPEPALESERASDVLRLKSRQFETDAKFEARLNAAKLEAMKQLAYGASHEINNPLANIATRAQALLNSESDRNRQQKLATIYEQAMRAHEMISDLMLFANPPALNVHPTNLRLLIAALIRDIETSLSKQDAFHRKTIDFRVRVGPDVESVTADPSQVSVLLHSLAKNSMESIEQTGSIEIDVRRNDQGSIEIAVTDDGVGVSNLAKPHLFDPFFSGREAGRGLGFGLSKAWRIAQLHDGSLTYDDTHQPGARFVLTLPR